MEPTLADEVRQFVRARYVEAARSAGKDTVTVRAGTVQRELGWWNRVPSVCSALDAREFQRMSGTRLIERRGPAQSSTVEWVLEVRDNGQRSSAPAPTVAAGERRLSAVWDGASFRPVVPPEDLKAGQQVVLTFSPADDARALAGKFAEFVGTLSAEEAAEMQGVLDREFEVIGDDW